MRLRRLAQQRPKNLVQPNLMKVLEYAGVCCVFPVSTGRHRLAKVVSQALPLLLRRLRSRNEGKKAHVNAMKARRAKLFIRILLVPNGSKSREHFDQLGEQVVLAISVHAAERLELSRAEGVGLID
jgi:hypothetical protein